MLLSIHPLAVRAVSMRGRWIVLQGLSGGGSIGCLDMELTYEVDRVGGSLFGKSLLFFVVAAFTVFGLYRS